MLLSPGFPRTDCITWVYKITVVVGYLKSEYIGTKDVQFAITKVDLVALFMMKLIGLCLISLYVHIVFIISRWVV